MHRYGPNVPIRRPKLLRRSSPIIDLGKDGRFVRPQPTNHSRVPPASEAPQAEATLIPLNTTDSSAIMYSCLFSLVGLADWGSIPLDIACLGGLSPLSLSALEFFDRAKREGGPRYEKQGR